MVEMAGSEQIGTDFDPRLLYEASRAAFHQGNLAKAILLADQILEGTYYSQPACIWAATLKLEAKEWRRVIEIGRIGLTKGNSANLLGILGQAHYALSEFSLAESALQGAIRMQPGYAPWMFHLARVLLRVDREFEALEILEAALRMAPDGFGLNRTAQLELSFGDAAAALGHALGAIDMLPNDATGHILAAKCLMELARDGEADDHWKKAAELSPNTAEEIQLIRVRYERELGQFPKASRRLDSLKIAHPNSVRIGAMALETSRCSGEDLPQIRRMESLLSENSITLGERIHLEYALGKALDDLGLYDGAMQHFNAANALSFQGMNPTRTFDRTKYALEVQARKDTFTEKVISRAAEIGISSESPIFVMGMIRSGTTLLEQILSRHPLVQGAGEQKFWPSLDSKLIDLPNRHLKESAIQQAASTYLRLLKRFHPSAQRVVDKQPGNLLLAGALHVAFPQARIIYVVRNPRDNAVSIWNTNIETSAPFVHDKGHLAFAIKQHEALRRHWEEVVPSNRFTTLSYESLVTDPESSIRRMLDFCGLPWSQACLTPDENHGRVITPSLWQVRQPIYQSSIGRWKNYEPWLGDFKELT